MSIFDIDYSTNVWNLLVPPAKRLSKWLAWGAALMAGKQWWNDSIFCTWAQGNSIGMSFNPDTSHTYHAGDRVIYPIQSETAGYTGAHTYYGDNAVYEALYSGFTAQAPSGTNVVSGTVPSWVVDTATALTWLNTGNNGNPFYWVKVSNNFIGVYERASYSCQKIMYEYALNRWFGTTFRQPAAGLSDIYIAVNTVTINQFYFYPSTCESFFAPATIIPPDPGPSSNFFFPSNSSPIQNDFTIYVPVLVYDALSAISGQREGVVRAFANLICPAGAFYNVVTY